MTGIRSVSVIALIVFCACLTLPALGAEGSGWQKVTKSGPSPRQNHAMAYDSSRGRVVLFGGNDGAPNGETWEWDGGDWLLRSGSGPSRRASHAMAYDSFDRRVVLFGGYDGDYRNDTWEWDGSAWALQSTSGPSPRRGHAMAYDSNRERLVLFGGVSGGYFGDTWEWDGNAWTLRANSGPSPRTNHAMAYDSVRRRVVLFGGSDGSNNNDTWEWDGNFWSLRSTSGPSPRRSHAMAYDSARRRVMLFGGNTEAFNGETWEWDGAEWTPLIMSGPRPRYSHGMAYDDARERVVLFGGFRTRDKLDGETWEYVSASCTGQERIASTRCRTRRGPSKLKVKLAGGTQGDVFTVRLNDGSVKAGRINIHGKGRAKFADRPPNDGGTATATWGCGARDLMEYDCGAEVADECDEAIELDIPSIRSGSTRQATIDEGFPGCGQGTEVIAPGVWYKVIGTGRAIRADTCTHATFNTKINVYENSCNNPICVVANNNSCEDRSAVVWDSIEGATYWILVHGTLNESGVFTLDVSEAGELKCEEVEALRLQCDPDNSDLVATLETSLPEGWYLHLTLDDQVTLPVRVSNRGIGVAVFEDVKPGPHRVCVDECPGMCELADCP